MKNSSISSKWNSHELLEAKGYKNVPIIRGSALKALEGDPEYVKSIKELMKTVDEKIPTPARETDKPFLMPMEDVFSISGRGTVATGRVERGKIKVNDKLQLVGIRETRDTVVTGLEMFNKLLDEAQAGENVGILLRGIGKERYRARNGARCSRNLHTTYKVQRDNLRSHERRRRTP